MSYDDDAYARLMSNVAKYKDWESYPQIKAFNEAMYLEHPIWFSPDCVVEGPIAMVIQNGYKAFLVAQTHKLAYNYRYFFDYTKVQERILAHWQSLEKHGFKIMPYVPFIMDRVDGTNGMYYIKTRYMLSKDHSARYLTMEEEREMTRQDWLLNGYPQKS